MTNTRRWKRFEQWVGKEGWIRAIENTHSDGGGFHLGTGRFDSDGRRRHQC